MSDTTESPWAVLEEMRREVEDQRGRSFSTSRLVSLETAERRVNALATAMARLKAYEKAPIVILGDACDGCGGTDWICPECAAIAREETR